VTYFDPLWVPLLTHYTSSNIPRLDEYRTSLQLMKIKNEVNQFLIAGTTGDGWELSDELLMDWIKFTQLGKVFQPNQKILFGAFGQTTAEVVRKARLIEEAIAKRPIRSEFAGLTICAPVKAAADQQEIIDHFIEIIESTSAPLAIYQLPQIVKCTISAETFKFLAQSTSRITLFKDTSGFDEIAKENIGLKNVKLLRGAEGSYVENLKDGGNYDGWLLSTANCFASNLRSIANETQSSNFSQAVAQSKELELLVNSLFNKAEEMSDGNIFSNINRAVDHIFAHGSEWRNYPARLFNGHTLSEEFLVNVDNLLVKAGFETQAGYIN
tara:strand:+ start:113 stop:1090 length:978 start_codon:yes stop_codon:yes gene_type:complete